MFFDLSNTRLMKQSLKSWTAELIEIVPNCVRKMLLVLFTGIFMILDFLIWVDWWERAHLQNVVDIVQLLSHIWLFLIPWTAAHQAPPSSTVSQIYAQIHGPWVSDAV